jgi:hypothetical protein
MNNQQQSFRSKIYLIRDLTELRGTCYFEILPGKYQEKCWNQNSVFMTEDSFGYLESIFEHHVSNFEHYAFVEISNNDWMLILADFSSLLVVLNRAQNIKELKCEVEFKYKYLMDDFIDDFQSSAIDLMTLIRDFSEWVQEQLKSQEYISVLGI